MLHNHFFHEESYFMSAPQRKLLIGENENQNGNIKRAIWKITIEIQNKNWLIHYKPHLILDIYAICI